MPAPPPDPTSGLLPAETRDQPPVEAPVQLDPAPPAGYVSDRLVDLLRELGCRYLPINPGSSFRGLHDSLVNYGGNQNPQLLLCHHEEIAVSMAHGYAKATGGVAVAAIHDLVGLMHASMAVYDAWADRVPLLLLGGGGPADTQARRRIDWLHSASVQAELVRDYVKWDDEPIDPYGLLNAVARGHQLAATAPAGPVYVTLDAELQERTLPDDGLPVPDPRLHRPTPGPGVAPDQVSAAARLLVAATRPVIVGGRVGYHEAATAPLVSLAESLAAAYQDDRNMVGFPTGHELNLNGDPGLLGEADVVLAVDLPDLTEVASSSASVVAITLDPVAPSRWSNAGQAPAAVDLTLVAEPVTALQQLADAVADLVSAEPAAVRRDRQRRRDELAVRHRRLRAAQQAAVAELSDQVPIAPAHLVASLWRTVRARPWLLALRNTRSWPEGIWQFPGAGTYLGHSGGGGVGYGPGAMVGAALAARDRGQLPVAVIGDGDLSMAPGALWTAVHYEIPLLVVVNNNRSFYNDEGHQQTVARHRGRPVANAWIGMRMDDPPVDFAGLARAYGAWAAGPVTDPGTLPDVLAAALSAVDDGRVALVDVHTAPS